MRGDFDEDEDPDFAPDVAAGYQPADEGQIDCPLCGDTVKLVSSATLSIALWQHINWVCKQRKDGAA